MAAKIRLSRAGAKKRPFYRMVVADSRSPRDGKFIEKVGTYDPLLAKDDAKRVVLKRERIEYWLSVGAQASEKVEKLVAAAGIVVPAAAKKAKKNVADKPKKAPKKQKAAQ